MYYNSRTCTSFNVRHFSPKEIHGFAIPTSRSSDQKHTTEVKPFSFDKRDQLLLTKKD
jgi:hypothetical protein